nr:MAG TPA: hypothetical protein [Caudoviricetes sp.]DAY71022.1 MAG TPA: hypothetical protein [Caudoviricetes sp.]
MDSLVIPWESIILILLKPVTTISVKESTDTIDTYLERAF